MDASPADGRSRPASGPAADGTTARSGREASDDTRETSSSSVARGRLADADVSSSDLTGLGPDRIASTTASRVLLGCAVIVLTVAAAGAIGAVVGSIDGSGTAPLHSDAGLANESLPSVDEREIEAAVHREVNDERVAHGESPLEWDPALRTVALHHSIRMGNEEFFAHTAPDGESMSDRYDRFGYDCRASAGFGLVYTGGENLVKTYHHTPVVDHGRLTTEAEIAEAAVAGWMESPGHRENLLEDHWSVQGIGVHVTDDREVYVTQNFC